MRRISLLAICILLLLALTVTVWAVPNATSVSSVATVNHDETCTVTMTVTIHLDAPTDELTFPVPEKATAVTLNGSRVSTTRMDGARHINLAKTFGSVAGDFSFVVTYRMDDLVHTNSEGFLELRMPLLAGFAHPVKKLEFSVTLPGEVTSKPAFSSGYHLSSIEQDLTFRVDGATISGSSLKTLKDRETLTMYLVVPDEMFPQSVIVLQDYGLIHTLMIISAVLAGLYWLLFLRSAPPRFARSTTPAEGYGAGQLGCLMHLQGADLTMMIFSWAQLGYVLIRLDKRGNVTVHKHMEMGNERSAFEQKCFKQLFGKRSQVDTSSYRYATLYQKVAKLSPNVHPFVHDRSGSVILFRIFAAILGLFAGICMGMALGADAAARGFIIFLLAVFGACSSCFLHTWADDLFRLGCSRLITALVLSTLWIILMCSAGMFEILIWVLLGQLLAGLLAAFGGRRTEAGKQARNQSFGLYRYLFSVSRNELLYICRHNPEYFHDMAPYALAMGIDKRFAKRFGKMKLPPCPYLDVPTELPMSALQWSKYLRLTASAMNMRRRQMPLERILGILNAFRK